MEQRGRKVGSSLVGFVRWILIDNVGASLSSLELHRCWFVTGGTLWVTLLVHHFNSATGCSLTRPDLHRRGRIFVDLRVLAMGFFTEEGNKRGIGRVRIDLGFYLGFRVKTRFIWTRYGPDRGENPVSDPDFSSFPGRVWHGPLSGTYWTRVRDHFWSTVLHSSPLRKSCSSSHFLSLQLISSSYSNHEFSNEF